MIQKSLVDEQTKHPSRKVRICAGVGVNILIFVAVAITNGFVIFFLGLISSCLLSSWVLTAFLVHTNSHKKQLALLPKVLLVTIGVLVCVGFIYGHPIYVGATLAVVIHEMRVLDRYNLGPLSAVFSPAISLLPIIPISHASYVELTLSSATYSFEPIIGYLLIIVILLKVVSLIKKDDEELLPLVGKTPEEYAFETIGVPKWIRIRSGNMTEKKTNVAALNQYMQCIRYSILEKATAQSRQDNIDIVAEAEYIAINCDIFQKKRNPAYYVDVVLQLLAYPNELACSIVHQFTTFTDRMEYNPFGTIMITFARMDSLYSGGMFRMKLLKENLLLAEAVVSRDTRLRRCGEILALSLLSLSQKVQDAREIYRTTSFDPSIREMVDRTLRHYNLEIADYITGIA